MGERFPSLEQIEGSSVHAAWYIISPILKCNEGDRYSTSKHLCRKQATNHSSLKPPGASCFPRHGLSQEMHHQGGFTPVPRPVMAAQSLLSSQPRLPTPRRMDLAQQGCPGMRLRAMAADQPTGTHLISIYHMPVGPAFKEIPLWWENIPAG